MDDIPNGTGVVGGLLAPTTPASCVPDEQERSMALSAVWVPIRGLVRATAAVVLLASAWWLFAPRFLGGYDTYVVVSGPSMWPKLVTGDLLVLRSAGRYGVGETAGYRTPQLRAPVVHQIIAADGGSYTFKGINNGFTDPSHPRAPEIIGRLWIDLGQTGRLLQWTKIPAVGGVLIFAAGAYAAWPRRRHRLHRHPRRTHDL
ncbi:MAG: S24/S26 family peptidase [Actinomycetota bacterium]|nr:S24/S26 family peptidase [Actinomycetota bacterium]